MGKQVHSLAIFPFYTSESTEKLVGGYPSKDQLVSI